MQQTSDNGAAKETSAKGLQSLGIFSHQRQEDVAMARNLNRLGIKPLIKRIQWLLAKCNGVDKMAARLAQWRFLCAGNCSVYPNRRLEFGIWQATKWNSICMHMWRIKHDKQSQEIFISTYMLMKLICGYINEYIFDLNMSGALRQYISCFSYIYIDSIRFPWLASILACGLQQLQAKLNIGSANWIKHSWKLFGTWETRHFPRLPTPYS